MFASQLYQQRRIKLKEQVESGLILLLGNNEVGMNYNANPYHFRQDSSFLYFVGIDQPNMAAIIDVDEGSEVLFGNDLTLDDIVWMGAHPTTAQLAEKTGIAVTATTADIENKIKAAITQGRTVHFLPPYRFENMVHLSQWLNIPVNELKKRASEKLIKAVIAQRAHKSAEEIVELEKAVTITGAMHIAAMKTAREGIKEEKLCGIAHGIALSMGGNVSYPIILTVDGQTLHNHYHGNVLQKGKLILGDFGAETGRHYAGDITRTFPVSDHFTPFQKDIYNIVLDAEVTAIESLKPGISYRDVHLAAARRMAEGLKSLGFMKGDLDEAISMGAHALFFPHGLGHMLGLDVHDMEDLGEDYVGYSDSIKRSEQFGTAYLRLGRELEPGFVLTVEPGLYFIPELIDKWQEEGKFSDFINYDKVNQHRDFGGVRIEDNILITEKGHHILGKPIPKTVEEIEAIRQG